MSCAASVSLSSLPGSGEFPVHGNLEQQSECQKRTTILWIDDFEPGLVLYCAVFEKLGFEVLTASSGVAGLKLAASRHVDVVITDYEMPHMRGDVVAASFKALDPKMPVIMFSGSTLMLKHLRNVVDAFCDKAESRGQLLATIHRVLHKKHHRSLQPPSVAKASDEGNRTVA